MAYLDLQDLGLHDESEAVQKIISLTNEVVVLNQDICRLKQERDRYRNALVKIMSSAASALDTE